MCMLLLHSNKRRQEGLYTQAPSLSAHTRTSGRARGQILVDRRGVHPRLRLACARPPAPVRPRRSASSNPRSLATILSKEGLNIDHHERCVIHAQRLHLAGGLQIGQWREEKLLLLWESLKKGDFGPTHHKALGLLAQEQRVLGSRVLHRHLEAPGRRHRRQLCPALTLL